MRPLRNTPFWVKAWLVLLSPFLALFSLLLCLQLGIVPDGVRQHLGFLILPVIFLFALPAWTGGRGFFEFGIGVGPAGVAGWIYTVVFWLMVTGMIAGLLAAFREGRRDRSGGSETRSGAAMPSRGGGRHDL